MANELTLGVSLSYANAAQNILANALVSGSFSVSISQPPGPYERNVLQISSTKVTLPLTLLSTLGYTLLHNCDSQNAILIFHTTSQALSALTLQPGEWALFRFSTGTTPQAQAVAGTPILEYYAVNA